MNISFLLKEYFKEKENVSIDVFDAHTINEVYQEVIKTLTSHFSIEVSVLQTLSYCFYEILDNVHIHSGKPLGTAITHFDDKNHVLCILVADDGKGIRESLAENAMYRNITEAEALKICLEDSVTDGKGMGFGLYATSRMMQNIGIKFVLHSGTHKLISENSQTSVIDNGFWQGTILYMELTTEKDVNPNEIVDHRTDAEGQYNEAFVETDALAELWTIPHVTTTFMFSDFGSDFGTREMGAKLREKIKQYIQNGQIVELNFSGVNVVSNSFADECISKMLLEIPLEKLKQSISFTNLNTTAAHSLLVALQRRYRTKQ